MVLGLGLRHMNELKGYAIKVQSDEHFDALKLLRMNIQNHAITLFGCSSHLVRS